MNAHRTLLGTAALLAIFYGAINVGWPFVVLVCGALMIAAALQEPTRPA